jgi:hypothetical protein
VCCLSDRVPGLTVVSSSYAVLLVLHFVEQIHTVYSRVYLTLLWAQDHGSERKLPTAEAVLMFCSINSLLQNRVTTGRAPLSKTQHLIWSVKLLGAKQLGTLNRSLKIMVHGPIKANPLFIYLVIHSFVHSSIHSFIHTLSTLFHVVCILINMPTILSFCWSHSYRQKPTSLKLVNSYTFFSLTERAIMICVFSVNLITMYR